METNALLEKRKGRKFLPADFVITDWESVAPFFSSLCATNLDSVLIIENWLRNVSEVESSFYEELAWRYIRMTCNTADTGLRSAYNDFIEQVLAPFKTEENKLREKFIQAIDKFPLDSARYGIMVRSIRNSHDLFREENVPIQARVQTLSQKLGEITGVMQIDHEGKSYTLPQASAFLEEGDRGLRETIWRKMTRRRLEDRAGLDDLYTNLVTLRQQIAVNGGFQDFVGYCFRELGRFDYSPQDCDKFHDAVEREIKPIYERFMQIRKEKLGLDVLKPWDLSVDIFGEEPLKPFSTASQLIDGTREIMNKLDPEFGSLFQTLGESRLLDLESRVGKAPGGYNYPLPETGLSFIFMNAVGTQGDLVTMVHEVGHAIHAGRMQHLELNEFRNTPSELAELASMSMELLTMEHWSVFFQDHSELVRAWYDELSRTITLLPWIATVDCFQRWVYEHPGHSISARSDAWISIFRRFHGQSVDWSGLEEELGALWQKQLHIFEVPFYYIEYGFAQLGALAVWRNYKTDPLKALRQYKEALSLGYTRSIPEVYEAAGIRFDFSHSYISELAAFVLAELNKLKA